MKKTSKILGSIALSAALAMGTAVPAFAADEYDTYENPVNANKEMSTGAATTITASTYTSQLSVTIPLTVPLQFNTIGGRGLAPSANTYYIRNNSSCDITVTEATFAIPNEAQGNWNFANVVEKATDETTKTVPDYQGNVAYGSYFLNIHPTATITNGGTAVDLQLAGTNTKRTGDTAQLNWGIKDHGKYGFQLDAFSSTLKKDLGLNQTEEVATISYTVKVGANGEGVALGETPASEDQNNPSAGVTKMSDAKSKVMNATGLTATFGQAAIYKLEGGSTADLGTDNWNVVSAKVKAGSKWVDVENDEEIDSAAQYEVTVSKAAAATDQS